MISKNDFINTLNSYMGYASKGNNYYFKKKMCFVKIESFSKHN